VSLCLGVLAVFGFGNLHGCLSETRSSEVECEEAVARLEECCGDSGHALRCIDRSESCDFVDNSPDIDSDQSDCLRALSCDDLRAQRLCEAFLDPELRSEACRAKP
jgi:hypothetical protein